MSQKQFTEQLLNVQYLAAIKNLEGFSMVSLSKMYNKAQQITLLKQLYNFMINISFNFFSEFL